jgi:3-hydroxyisobutyrate dehydrogenase-like beta-hydroxyacid dehydrogenase
MGGPMAKNLLKNGHKLIVNDISSASVNELKNEGADVSDNPADIASKTSVIITMLPSRYMKKVVTNQSITYCT